MNYCWWLKSGEPVEVGSLSHYLQGFSTIPGGCLGFQPSTVWGVVVCHWNSAFNVKLKVFKWARVPYKQLMPIAVFYLRCWCHVSTVRCIGGSQIWQRGYGLLSQKTKKHKTVDLFVTFGVFVASYWSSNIPVGICHLMEQPPGSKLQIDMLTINGIKSGWLSLAIDEQPPTKYNGGLAWLPAKIGWTSFPLSPSTAWLPRCVVSRYHFMSSDAFWWFGRGILKIWRKPVKLKDWITVTMFIEIPYPDSDSWQVKICILISGAGSCPELLR